MLVILKCWWITIFRWRKNAGEDVTSSDEEKEAKAGSGSGDSSDESDSDEDVSIFL